MVHEQGEVIDSIESNIESTTVQVSSGTDQLRQVSGNLQSLSCSNNITGHFQAAVYQNKARRKKIILALIGLVILGKRILSGKKIC